MKNSRSLLSLLLILLLTLSCQAQSVSPAAVQTINFKSKLVGATLPYIVELPPGYEDPSPRAKRYPVLYLLHGLGGSYQNWTAKTRLREYAAQYRMIIVTPEGSEGWYTDGATAANDKYESYLLQELIPDVEHRFRAIRRRQGRAIAGLSMGGYGALKFGVKHPEKFVFAGSMSGALDPAVRSETNQGFAWGFVRPSILKVFGAEDSLVRVTNDLHRLFRDLPASRIKLLPYLYFDCGTEDGFLKTNRDLEAILRERKIPHEYRELPGKHEWAYWDQQVREVLKLAAERMAKQ
jgi:S-formylglutathione hydrolase FrmB